MSVKARPECSEGRMIIKEMHTENKLYHFGNANSSFAASNDSLTREMIQAGLFNRFKII